MKLKAHIPVTVGFTALLLLSATGCKHLLANDQINKGVAAFKNARYEEAEDHFQKAISIDPDNPNPRLYLATTYASQIVPNLDSADNKKVAQKALDGFQEVLQRDPNNVNALKQIASINRNTGKSDEAKEYEKKVIALAPNDAEAHYTIGVVDWIQAFKNTSGVLHAENLQDNINGNYKISKGGCATLVTQNTAPVNEGMQYLQKAIDINPTYEEAMTYMSLMYRQKADIDCADPNAIKADIAQADVWAQKTMGARKENERRKEEKNKGGITQ